MCCFTDSAYPFQGAANGKPCTTYTKFAAYAVMNHGGDFSKAASALSKDGYGTRPEKAKDRRDERPEFVITAPRTLRQLAVDCPRLNEPLIDGLLRRAELANIVSETKLGKSWLMLYTTITCVGGGKLFDRYRTTPGKVLYLDNELHGSTIANRAFRVGDAMGLSRDAYQDSIHYEVLRGRRLDVYQLGKYLEQFKPGDFSYVVLDALYRAWPTGESENENGVWVDVMNMLEVYAERLQVAWLTVHHSTKGLQGDKRVTDVGAGGGSQSRAADAHIVLRQHEQPGVSVVDAALRSFAPITPFCLRWRFPLWEPADDCDPTRLKTNRPTKAGQTKPEAEADPAKPSKFEAVTEAAIAVLEKLGPVTKSRWKEEAGIGGSRINAIVERALADNRIEVTEVQTPKGTFEAYRIKGGKSDTSDTSDSPGSPTSDGQHVSL